MRLVSLLASLSPLTVARLLHSVPEDPHAFPKFRVSFLNALSTDTAHQWSTHGLRGGLLEFLDQPWNDDSPREIDGGVLVSTQDVRPCQKCLLAGSLISPFLSSLCLPTRITLSST